MVLYLCTAEQWSYNNIELLPYLCSCNIILQGLIWFGVKFSFYPKPLICNLKGAFTFSFKGHLISNIEYTLKGTTPPGKQNEEASCNSQQSEQSVWFLTLRIVLYLFSVLCILGIQQQESRSFLKLIFRNY